MASSSSSLSKGSSFLAKLVLEKPDKIKLAQQFNRLNEEKIKLKRTAEKQKDMLKKYARIYSATSFKIGQLDRQMCDIKGQIEELDADNSGFQETVIDLTL